jgi:hypothetical protein
MNSETSDNGLLDIYCLDCSEMLSWRREHVIREDGAYTWRIVASCGCGEVDDPEIRARARAAYDAASVNDVFNIQEAAMERILGPELHEAFNNRIGPHLEGGTDKPRLSAVSRSES